MKIWLVILILIGFTLPFWEEASAAPKNSKLRSVQQTADDTLEVLYEQGITGDVITEVYKAKGGKIELVFVKKGKLVPIKIVASTVDYTAKQASYASTESVKLKGNDKAKNLKDVLADPDVISYDAATKIVIRGKRPNVETPFAVEVP